MLVTEFGGEDSPGQKSPDAFESLLRWLNTVARMAAENNSKQEF